MVVCIQISVECQQNGRTVRLCPLLRKTTTIALHFAHARAWLFIVPITKLLLDFVHLLLKCGSRNEATHLSLNFFKTTYLQLSK